MNMFEIHDKNGNAVTLGDLDAQACFIWGKDVDPKHYAYPQHKPEKFASYKESFQFAVASENWFDKIGWMIAKGETNWSKLKGAILKIYLDNDIPIEELTKYPEIWGFILLINNWELKGYKAVSLDGDYNVLAKGGIRTATEAETTVV